MKSLIKLGLFVSILCCSFYSSAELSSNLSSNSIEIPKHALKIAPSIYFLGTGFERQESGELLDVDGYAIVQYDQSKVNVKNCNFDYKCQKSEDILTCPDCELDHDSKKCYKFWVEGAKWKRKETYSIDLSNSLNLEHDEVVKLLKQSIEKWESFSGVDILGDYQASKVEHNIDFFNPDKKNEILFNDIKEKGVISIVVVWGIFNGPIEKREILEWDLVFDQVDYKWSISGEIDKLDLLNIINHQIGHAMGLSDLYNTLCEEQVMFSYIKNGEIKKQVHKSGDINGIIKIYGKDKNVK